MTVIINGAVSVKGSVTINGNVQSEVDLTGDMAAGDLLEGKTGYGDDANTKITGTKPDKGANNVEVTTLAGTTIPAGSYNGFGKAILSAAEIEKVVVGNIKKDVVLLGVTGTLEAGGTDTSDATMAAGDLVLNKTGYGAAGTKITGTLARVWPEVVEGTYYNFGGNGYVGVRFDHNMMPDPSGKEAEFSVEADSVPMTITEVGNSNGNSIYTMLSAEFGTPTIVKISYTKGTVLDSHDIPLQSFADVECSAD